MPASGGLGPPPDLSTEHDDSRLTRSREDSRAVAHTLEPRVPDRRTQMAAAPAAAPARALVSSSSSPSRGVHFCSGTSHPNLRSAAASASAPGWRRRDPAVSVAAGSAQSALGALAVDPKVWNCFLLFFSLLFCCHRCEINWGLGRTVSTNAGTDASHFMHL